MTQSFMAIMKFAEVKVGDVIEVTLGTMVKISTINQIKVLPRKTIVIYGTGETVEKE